MNKGAVYLAAICCALSSCSVFKHNKKGADAVVATPIPPSPPPLPIDTAAMAKADSASINAKLIAEATSFWQRRLAYSTFAGKAHIAYAGPKNSREFSANIRMKKDSVIWVTITFLGIPAARVFVTPDSLFMVNYVQKEAARIPLSASADYLPAPVDFATLQNLIVGDPLRAGTLLRAIHDDRTWNLFAADAAYEQQLTYASADSTLSMYNLRTVDPKGPEAMVNNKRFEDVIGRRMPMQRNIVIQNGNDHYTVDMEMQSAAFDVEQEYPFSIPKNYTVK